MDMTNAISLIVTAVIKPTIVILVIWLLWLLIRKRSAALQHFVLSVGLISVLLLPLFSSFLPVIEGRWVSILVDVLQSLLQWVIRSTQEIFPHTGTINFIVLLGIYLLPATWLLFYLLLGVLGLHRQAASGQPIQASELQGQLIALRELLDINREVTVLTSRKLDSPYTWGLWRPVIMLPREALLWDEDKQLSVLIHELGHIARWDWLSMLLVKITCACFWFLLPVWWLAQRIYEQAEIACDDYVYKLRDKQIVYAQSLLAIASNSTSAGAEPDALPMRGQSPIHTRIMAVLDKQRPHHSIAVEAAQYWIICGGLLLALFSCVQIIPLQTQLQARVQHLLILGVSAPSAVTPDLLNVRIEQFSWALLQQLKPQLQNLPASVAQLETVQVEAAVPLAKAELQEWARAAAVQKKSVSVPAIQIQGFLPIDMVTPEYPAQALAKGIEGWVSVEFIIDTTGAIVAPKIIGHAPSRIFDRSVLLALKKSRYRPQLLDGVPVIVQGVTEVFRFTLHAATDDQIPSLDDSSIHRR